MPTDLNLGADELDPQFERGDAEVFAIWLEDQLVRTKRQLSNLGSKYLGVTAVQLPAATGFQDMLSFTIPTGFLLNKGQHLRLSAYGKFISSAATKDFRLRLNSITVFGTNAYTTSDFWRLVIDIYAIDNNEQIVQWNIFVNGNNPNTAQVLQAEDATADIVMTLQGRASTAVLGNIEIQLYEVEYFNKDTGV